MLAHGSLKKFLAGLGLAACLIGFVPAPAAALPLPGTKQPYKLFAKALKWININRVFMGIRNDGEVGVDTSGAGTTGGGFWPRGTADQYIFNAGLQVAGVVAGTKSAANPWGGDTAGGWFFDGNGGRKQTEGVTLVYQAYDATDAANWPADAFVPQGDEVANIYATPLQGLISASQGDVHFIAWEGNPANNIGRLHPLGVLVDYRLLGWNYPAGAQDIVFLVASVYNVTSANCADYAQHRAGIRDILCKKGQDFQALNNAKFGITLPAGGYTIGTPATPAYLAVAADNDVTTGGNNNYNGLILPFAMGYTYEGLFTAKTPGAKFDPSIFGPPFLAGSGFVGYKYLKGPDGPGQIGLFTTFCNGNCGGTAGHGDPANTHVNYRLLAGTPAPTDGQCNVTSPGVTQAQLHVCFMLYGPVGADTRMAESSAGLTLTPGGLKTIVVAFVYAPPVAIPGFTNDVANVPPTDVTISNSTDSMFKYNQSGSPGVNRIDSITGFLAYLGPHFNADGTVHQPVQSEFRVVKNSLLSKALVAQAVFDVKFLQEFAPEAPQFFLIPGDKQVTILWKPSATETLGDPFFQVVANATQIVAGATVANPLYDPNYRRFDVEGYRIYRGRSDSPNALRLLVQFDYAGTTFKDFTGTVVSGNCAPEIGVATDCPATTPAGGFPTNTLPTPAGLSPAVPPGVTFTRFATYNIGPQPDASPLQFVDQTAGTRVALLGGTTSLATVVDTAVSGGGLGFPPLNDAGVPFIFVDKVGAVNCSGCGVNNGVKYFYSVTAFDVNAPGHGPTSLESAKATKEVTPQQTAGDVSVNHPADINGVFGRGAAPLTDATMPSIDATTGKFSKKFPPSTALVVALASLPVQIINGSGAAAVTFDSTSITALVGADHVSVIDWFTGGTTKIAIPQVIGATTGNSTGGGAFPALAIDSALSSPYGGGAGFSIGGVFSYQRQAAYISGIWGRGCINGGLPVPTGKAGGQCYFFGPRWFNGDNETVSNPNVAAPVTNVTGAQAAASFNNAGALTGVATIYMPNSYGYITGSQWRDFELAISPFATASDYRVYWGAAGKIDSVIDLTYNTVVPFKTRIGSSWGILNQSAATVAGSYDANANLTASDFACVAPLPNFSAGGKPACTVSTVLANTAVAGPISFAAGARANMQTSPAAANPGFGLYIKGRVFIFELTGGILPLSGQQWTMRDYIGAIFGGNGTDPACATACQFGAYAYAPPIPVSVGGVTPPVTAALPFTAPGAFVGFTFSVTNSRIPVTNAILAKVHTVPDPYYVTSAFDIAVNAKDIQFVNVPVSSLIRIYSSSGVLIRVLQNTSTTLGGIVHWNVRNRTNQFVSSGVYFYSVESGTSSFVGRMTIVNYASTVQ